MSVIALKKETEAESGESSYLKVKVRQRNETEGQQKPAADK